jgi:uncharacterized protein YfkK (UPF0435 family)
MKKLLFLLVLSIVLLTNVSGNDVNAMEAPYHLDDISITIHRMDAPLARAAINGISGIEYYLSGSSISWTITFKELSGEQLSKNSLWPNSEIIQLKPNSLDYDVLSEVNAEGFAYSYRVPSEYTCIDPLYLHLYDSYGADAYFHLGNDKTCNNVNANGDILSLNNFTTSYFKDSGAYPVQTNSVEELSKIKAHFSLVKSANNPKVYLVSKKFGIKHHVKNMDSLRTWWDAFDKKIDIISNNQLNKLENVNEDSFTFDSIEDLKDVYSMLENNENFILTRGKVSTLVIADNYYAKVNNGELLLLAKEK